MKVIHSLSSHWSAPSLKLLFCRGSAPSTRAPWVHRTVLTDLIGITFQSAQRSILTFRKVKLLRNILERIFFCTLKVEFWQVFRDNSSERRITRGRNDLELQRSQVDIRRQYFQHGQHGWAFNSCRY